MADTVQACPFCGSYKLYRYLVEWEAKSLESQDSNNTATLVEHQCSDCARSFWS